MIRQTVEYILRMRPEELHDTPTVAEHACIGDEMADLFMEIEAVAADQEIVSRTVLSADGRLPQVRCAARKLDPTRHYATSRRWQIQTPDGETVTTCSAACALSWFCEQVPADVAERGKAHRSEADTGEEGAAA